MGLKKALLVGCNYPGTGEQLSGCVNDVLKMRDCLMKRFGFAKKNIAVLIDTDAKFTRPTGANVRRALTKLVSSAAPDDILVFHFSGHGTRIPAENDKDDETGYDECIYLTDKIEEYVNDDFRELVNMVPTGCRITIISDSCHSGGLIEQAEEQIGDSTQGRDDEEAPQEEARVKSRFLPFSTLIEILKQKSGKEEISRGELRSTLAEIFGEDSSLKIQEFIQQLREQRKELNAGDGKKGIPSRGVLISGCQSDQTSLEVNPTGNPADAYGALSHAILTVVEGTEEEISNTALVEQIREWMVQQGYDQEPGLYCSDELADAPFIC